MPGSGQQWSCVGGVVLLFFISLTGLVPLMFYGKRSIEGVPDVASWTTVWDLKIPQSIYDHIFFSAFDGTNVYTAQASTHGENSRPPKLLEKIMFNKVRDDARAYLVTQGHTFQRHDCNDVRFRDVPSKGVEADVICSSPSSSHVERVTIYTPLAAPLITLHTSTPKSDRINIILPLKGRPEALRLFLTNLKILMLTEPISLSLTVVYFQDEYTNRNQREVEKANGISGLHTQFILLKQNQFSRSKALKVGVEKSDLEAPIVFLCDVDVMFTRDFFQRCLATPIQGKQVFFPMVFSQYNPELVYSLHGKKVPKPLASLQIDDTTGFWRLWGHGMVCLYRSDFRRINGFNPRRNGWGGEDLRFLEKTTKMKYKVIRSLDPGLFHHYHPKHCNDVAKGQQMACKRLQALGEASSIDFGLWYFRNEYNTSIWGVLKEQKQWENRLEEEWRNVTLQEEEELLGKRKINGHVGADVQDGADEYDGKTGAHEGEKCAHEKERTVHEEEESAHGEEKCEHGQDTNAYNLNDEVATLRMALILAVTLNIALTVCLFCRHMLPTRIRRWI